MGQPIKLIKGKETLFVYGNAQAALHLADGWKMAGTLIEPDEPKADVVEPKPEPAKAKPKRKSRGK